MKRTASISTCGTYRYSLSRSWDNSKPRVTFICLNPSTADATTDDPTLRKCIAYAKSWGHGGLLILNLFAYRSCEPAAMKNASDPIGPKNDKKLSQAAKNGKIIIAAWGNDGAFNGRSCEVAQNFPNLKCLKVNKTGEPSHPLYLKANLKPISYQRPCAC